MMADKDPKTGRFVPGNKASPGRKPRPTEASYIEAMYGVADPADWAKATKAMLDLAKKGDVQAYRAIVPYYAGLPVQKLQISSQDAALLAEVLELMKSRGVSASEVFSAMIAQLASVSAEMDEAENDE